MAVDVWDEAGQPAGLSAGELVCTRPFPSMPVAFWNDPTGAAYRAAYFEHFPGVWRHGDWAEMTRHRGYVIYPGKLTVADSFRIGCIGALGEAEMRGALEAIRAVVAELGVASCAPAGG